MRKILFIALLAILSAAARAQQTPVVKYDIVYDGYDQMFYNMTRQNVLRVIHTDKGSYTGQVSDEGKFEGYAIYEGVYGGSIAGQYFDSKLLFGITMNSEIVKVGTSEFFATYSATTGDLMGVIRKGELVEQDPALMGDYKFAKVSYSNGDRYVGELYKGVRHGYGTYYFKNGGFWYGPFNNGLKHGYGAWFTADSKMRIGKWQNDKME